MRKLAIGIAVGIVVTITWFCGRNSMSRAADLNPPVRQAWEYKDVKFTGDIDEINALGKDGWEVFNVVPVNGNVSGNASWPYLLLKRQR
jgi:hypothetical protein